MKTLKLNTVNMQEARQAIQQAASRGVDLRTKTGADGKIYIVEAGKEAVIYES